MEMLNKEYLDNSNMYYFQATTSHAHYSVTRNVNILTDFFLFVLIIYFNKIIERLLACFHDEFVIIISSYWLGKHLVNYFISKSYNK